MAKSKVTARTMKPSEVDEEIKAPVKGGRKGAPKLSDEDAEETTTDIVAVGSKVGVTNAKEIAERLAKAGIGRKLTGGTLPLIKFTKDKDEGASFIGRLAKRTMAKDADPDDPHFYLSFDLINVDQLCTDPKNVDAAVVGRGQLLETTGLREWGESAEPGALVQITYHGDSKPSRQGWSGMQHFTVEALEL